MNSEKLSKHLDTIVDLASQLARARSASNIADIERRNAYFNGELSLTGKYGDIPVLDSNDYQGCMHVDVKVEYGPTLTPLQWSMFGDRLQAPDDTWEDEPFTLTIHGSKHSDEPAFISIDNSRVRDEFKNMLRFLYQPVWAGRAYDQLSSFSVDVDQSNYQFKVGQIESTSDEDVQEKVAQGSIPRFALVQNFRYLSQDNPQRKPKTSLHERISEVPITREGSEFQKRMNTIGQLAREHGESEQFRAMVQKVYEENPGLATDVIRKIDSNKESITRRQERGEVNARNRTFCIVDLLPEEGKPASTLVDFFGGIYNRLQGTDQDAIGVIVTKESRGKKGLLRKETFEERAYFTPFPVQSIDDETREMAREGKIPRYLLVDGIFNNFRRDDTVTKHMSEISGYGVMRWDKDKATEEKSRSQTVTYKLEDVTLSLVDLTGEIAPIDVSSLDEVGKLLVEYRQSGVNLVSHSSETSATQLEFSELRPLSDAAQNDLGLMVRTDSTHNGKLPAVRQYCNVDKLEGDHAFEFNNDSSVGITGSILHIQTLLHSYFMMKGYVAQRVSLGRQVTNRRHSSDVEAESAKERVKGLEGVLESENRLKLLPHQAQVLSYFVERFSDLTNEIYERHDENHPLRTMIDDLDLAAQDCHNIAQIHDLFPEKDIDKYVGLAPKPMAQLYALVTRDLPSAIVEPDARVKARKLGDADALIKKVAKIRSLDSQAVEEIRTSFEAFRNDKTGSYKKLHAAVRKATHDSIPFWPRALENLPTYTQRLSNAVENNDVGEAYKYVGQISRLFVDTFAYAGSDVVQECLESAIESERRAQDFLAPAEKVDSTQNIMQFSVTTQYHRHLKHLATQLQAEYDAHVKPNTMVLLPLCESAATLYAHIKQVPSPLRDHTFNLLTKVRSEDVKGVYEMMAVVHDSLCEHTPRDEHPNLVAIAEVYQSRADAIGGQQ